MDKKTNTPTILIILGATGDLAAKKIFPALHQLHKKRVLPKLLKIIAFSRRDWDNARIHKSVKEAVKDKVNDADEQQLSDYLKVIYYEKGNFEKLDGYQSLARDLGKTDKSWKTCANKLFYVAAPPKYYKSIFTNLSKSGLTEPCSDEEGWTRVIVEKPFGKDLKTAIELDGMLDKLYKEEQVYRIDHYLGKEMLQNILAFRFSNNIFDHSWSNKYIDSIEIKLLERKGVEDRGAFYDGVGALRDVGQNHLLQMLALATMENPGAFDAESVRSKREELLKNLVTPTSSFVKAETFRAQHEGYKDIGGVESDSNTETYFKSTAYLDSPRWRGVKLTLEAGKGMNEQKKEIVVRFKHPVPCLCPANAPHDYHNKVIFALEPKEEITFRLWSKKPGYSLEVEKRSFDLPYREEHERPQYTEEYEKLLLDCFNGDQMSFVSSGELKEMWRYTDPIVSAWKKGFVDLISYKKEDDSVRQTANKKLGEGKVTDLKKEIGIIGLGKMGMAIARNLNEKGWGVVAYNRSGEKTNKIEKEGVDGAYSLNELVEKLAHPRAVWIMLPAGSPTNDAVSKLSKLLEEGDTVIDGSNSFYEDAINHSNILKDNGINFVDIGVSGGPSGARDGACLMVGGTKKLYEKLLPLYVDLSVPKGHEHFDGAGAGHFVKMVHNGIEYGMMQAIAEGFDIMKNSDYKLHLKDIANVYDHGSVIESRLIGWMRGAFEVFGDDLMKVSGSAGSGGAAGLKKSEGAWTVEVAKKLGVSSNVIEDSVNARTSSTKEPSYQGKVINALRNRFGGHAIEEN